MKVTFNTSSSFWKCFCKRWTNSTANKKSLSQSILKKKSTLIAAEAVCPLSPREEEFFFTENITKF